MRFIVDILTKEIENINLNKSGELMNNLKCKLADFDVLFESEIKNFDIFMRNFLCDFYTSEISVCISDDDVSYEGEGYTDKVSFGTIQRVAAFRKLAEKLPEHNAFVLHSACFDVDGVGVAFAAHSGTGKTTHMNLWQKLLGDKMVVVNGDKPIIRFFDDEPETPYAYGTPWNGKEHLGCNMRTKLEHICFIERSETNFVEKIDKANAIERIIKQIYMPQNPIAVMKTMELIDRLLSCCNLWKIHCNMEDQAAEVAYNTIFGE